MIWELSLIVNLRSKHIFTPATRSKKLENDQRIQKLCQSVIFGSLTLSNTRNMILARMEPHKILPVVSSDIDILVVYGDERPHEKT